MGWTRRIHIASTPPSTPHATRTRCNAERAGSARGRVTHASTLNALPSLPAASDGKTLTEGRAELDEKDGMHIKIVVWLEGHRANELHNGRSMTPSVRGRIQHGSARMC